MNVIGDVEGRTCILQDDIIDTAGTIQKAANALKAADAARVLACAVHPVLSGPAIDRIQNAPIDQIDRDEHDSAARRGTAVQEDRRAVGGATAGTGDQEHSRGDIGFVAVFVVSF